MRKEDMTPGAAGLEALTIMFVMGYLVLQIYYGIHFHIRPIKFAWNICAAILVYAALFLLQLYPERVNRLTPEMFTADIRRLTIRMLRIIKFVFIAGLLVPSVFDVIGIGIYKAASLVVVCLIVAVAFFYEMKIYRILKSRMDK